MFVITIFFIGTFYYRLAFRLKGLLMLNFMIKKKLNEKSHFLYLEDLRVGFNPMAQEYLQNQDQSQGRAYVNPQEGRV